MIVWCTVTVTMNHSNQDLLSKAWNQSEADTSDDASESESMKETKQDMLEMETDDSVYLSPLLSLFTHAQMKTVHQAKGETIVRLNWFETQPSKNVYTQDKNANKTTNVNTCIMLHMPMKGKRQAAGADLSVDLDTSVASEGSPFRHVSPVNTLPSSNAHRGKKKRRISQAESVTVRTESPKLNHATHSAKAGQKRSRPESPQLATQIE